MSNIMNKVVDNILEKDPRRKREAIVNNVQQLTEKMRRITLSGDDVDKFLDDERVYEPASWIKIFIPYKGILAGRVYTISGIDKVARTFDIDMVLHNDGPASNWARDVLINDKLGFAGPCSGGFKLLEQSHWLLLLGDETALPAMKSILDSLNGTIPVFWFAEVSSEKEIQSLNYPNLVVNSWQIRDRYFNNIMNNPLVRVINGYQIPNRTGQIWMACEQQVVAYLKSYFINEINIPKSSLFAKGYWKKGESNFKGAV